MERYRAGRQAVQRPINVACILAGEDQYNTCRSHSVFDDTQPVVDIILEAATATLAPTCQACARVLGNETTLDVTWELFDLGAAYNIKSRSASCGSM